jgi:alkylated DNA nucleotide flippase Atl1
MIQPPLLEVPISPSPRLRRIAELSGALETAKRNFNILTHFSDVDELPWLAVITNHGETRDIGQLMSEQCGTLEDSGRTDYGRTEIEAVACLIRRHYPTALELRELVELMELES